MKKLIFTFLGSGLFIVLLAQTTEDIRIQVNASKQIATVTKLFNGTN